jgi:glycosyltransferase involved in cell wall biosynthesis
MIRKLKVGIYGPAKNEFKHVDDWYASCKDADVIHIADTGSTDGTKERLIELGVNVTDVRIVPWRFDDAFNTAMYLLPEDVDVCIRLDMDERLQPGWRDALEKAWTPETTRLRYPYVWNWNDDGTPGRQWYCDRIHARRGFRWMGATHEGLCSRVPEVQTFTDDVKIFQYPDQKDKKGDLELLLESCRDWPQDARLRAYLAREYMYQGQPEKSTETYKEFLAMSWDRIERGQAMVNLSWTDPDNKEFWLRMAATETPGHREPLVNLAQLYYDRKDWPKCYKAAKDALAITLHPMDYTCTPEAWGWQPHDLLSISAWNLGLYHECREHAALALEKSPNDQRLKNNLKLVEDYLEKNGGKQEGPRGSLTA